MSQKSLSTRSLLELIDLFERSIDAVADGDGQRLRGVPGWDLARRVALSDRDLAAWTERIGYADCYMAADGDERLPSSNCATVSSRLSCAASGSGTRVRADHRPA